MAKREIISGQKAAWQIQKKTGEGDAGEIFEVASMSSTQTAFLKRPVMSAFRGDIFRQSSQIRNEARIIAALNKAANFDDNLRVSVPRLLDQSKQGPEYNEGNFIILEKAEGLNLGLLARVAMKGLDTQEELSLTKSEEGRVLLREIAETGRFPETLLVDILMRLAHYLDFIHHLQSNENGKVIEGIIWNDVKPEHLFWDPTTRRLTIIDWGNARFLDPDQTIVNHQFTWMDDFRQFFDEMGRFLKEQAPGLIEKLGWADFSELKTIPPRSIDEIKTRLKAHLKHLSQPVESGEINARRRDLDPGLEITPDDLRVIENQIRDFGSQEGYQSSGSPEYWMQFLINFAGTLSNEDRLDDLGKLARWAASLKNMNRDFWKVIEILVDAALEADDETAASIHEVIQNAVAMRWEDVAWKTTAQFQADNPPEWRQELIHSLRRLALSEDQASVRPLEGLWRVYYTLQSLLISKSENLEAGDEFQPDYVRQLMNQISTEIIPNWTMLEPTPPDSRLDYRMAMQVITEAVSLLPEKDQPMIEIFKTPAARVEEVLVLWENKVFPAAAEKLRYTLLCDPDRLRVLRVEEFILGCGQWLEKIQTGPDADVSFADWIFDAEFHATELRSQVGPTSWLERILDACRLLQKGQWPADMIGVNPELLREMPWLASFDRRENEPSLEPSVNVALLRSPVFNGMEESRIGLDESMALVGPLDAWVPEARGSSARVLSGLLQVEGASVSAAVKLMRMDQVHYAQPLFREEAVILSRLSDVAGVAKMIECGFIQLDDTSEFPLEAGFGHPPAVGKVVRIGQEKVEEFLHHLDERIQSGWTPYLAIEKQEQDNNLLYACDAGMTRGRYQPLMTLLKIVVQICDILEIAHSRGIVYRDHKILHYYWDNPDHSLTMIDWNVARYHPEGLRETDIEMDIVQFGARGMHHILTGRTAPGALPLGPTRPEEIEAAALTYKTHWTYDDARLPQELKEIMERVLSGGYTTITCLRDDIKKTLMIRPVKNSTPAVE